MEEMTEIKNEKQHKEAMYIVSGLIYSNEPEDIKEFERIVKLITDYEEKIKYYKK